MRMELIYFSSYNSQKYLNENPHVKLCHAVLVEQPHYKQGQQYSDLWP